ncbi:MAG: VOC family protein [Sphingobacteriales bacterium]|nr:MAG: VOC family protein [Sphingobacteriales bacterium]
MMNPVVWFEIYVNDMNRAVSFYETVLAKKLEAMPAPEGFDGEMYAFPSDQNGGGASGALVKMECYKPSGMGTIVYFGSEDCAVELSRVEQAGGKIIDNKTSIGAYGFIGLVSDTEGNTIGFHSMQ